MLEAIAAVFLGMTMSEEVKPRVLFTFLGVWDNGLTQMNVDSYIREILINFIVILAVAFSSITKKRN